MNDYPLHTVTPRDVLIFWSCWQSSINTMFSISFLSMFREIFGHNRSKSLCFQVMLWSSSSSINLRDITQIPVNWLIISMKSWTSTGYLSNATSSSVAVCSPCPLFLINTMRFVIVIILLWTSRWTIVLFILREPQVCVFVFWSKS